MEKKVLKFGSNSQKVPDKQKQCSKVATIPFAIFKCLYLTKQLASLWLEMQREVTLLIFSQNYIFLALYRSRINISNTTPARARLSRNRIKTNVPCQPADKQTVHVALNWPKLRKKRLNSARNTKNDQTLLENSTKNFKPVKLYSYSFHGRVLHFSTEYINVTITYYELKSSQDKSRMNARIKYVKSYI